MGINVNNVVIESNGTINLINQNNEIHRFVCTALNSKPDVVLSLYDTNTGLPLSDGLNNKSTGFCDSNNLCSQVLQVDFQFTDSRFLNMSSLTCAAVSNNPNVDLTTSIQRNVTILTIPPTTSIILRKILFLKQAFTNSFF